MGGLTSLLLLLCVGVTVSAAMDLQKRIIGGGDCKPEERGYHVKFVRGKDDLLCGGSLLKNNWILTAAHCWEWAMKAVVGVHPGPEPAPVLIRAPPVMYGDNNNLIHDVMLLKLPPDFNSAHITPVDLPDCTKKLKLGDAVQIAGHAATTTRGSHDKRGCDVATKLQCANIKLTDCTKLKSIMDIFSYNHWLCGETSDPKVDACHGDSGGGVVVGNMIYGVISFSGNPKYASKEALALMDICEYVKWIKDTTKS